MDEITLTEEELQEIEEIEASMGDMALEELTEGKEAGYDGIQSVEG